MHTTVQMYDEGHELTSASRTEERATVSIRQARTSDSLDLILPISVWGDIVAHLAALNIHNPEATHATS